jgi:hypothetical protein
MDTSKTEAERLRQKIVDREAKYRTIIELDRREAGWIDTKGVDEIEINSNMGPMYPQLSQSPSRMSDGNNSMFPHRGSVHNSPTSDQPNETASRRPSKYQKPSVVSSEASHFH